MSDRITLNFSANTDDVERGTDRIADGLDKTADKLDDVGRAGEQAGQDAAGGLDEAGDAADGVSDRLGDLSSVGTQVLKGDLGGAAESAAGSLAVLGPVGALAGTVLAAGIGLATTAIQDQQKEADELARKLATMWQGAIANGQDYIASTAIIAEAQDIILNPDRLDEYNRAQTDARDLGIDVQTVVLAQAGDQQSLNVVLEAAAAKQQRYNDTLAGAADAGERNNLTKTREGELADSLVNRYQALDDAHTTAAENAQNASNIAVQLNAQEAASIARTSAADQARYQALADKQAAAANPPPIQQKVLFDVDTTKLDRVLRKIATSPHQVIVDVKTRDGKPVP